MICRRTEMAGQLSRPAEKPYHRSEEFAPSRFRDWLRRSKPQSRIRPGVHTGFDPSKYARAPKNRYRRIFAVTIQAIENIPLGRPRADTDKKEPSWGRFYNEATPSAQYPNDRFLVKRRIERHATPFCFPGALEAESQRANASQRKLGLVPLAHPVSALHIASPQFEPTPD